MRRNKNDMDKELFEELLDFLIELTDEYNSSFSTEEEEEK